MNNNQFLKKSMYIGLGLVLSDTNMSDTQSAYRHSGNHKQMLLQEAPSSTRPSNIERFSLHQLKFNKQKLESFKSLNKGWNGYNSLEISDKLINNVSNIISELDYQPQIFPTGRGSIQLEKYIDDNNLIEIEISEDEFFAYKVKNGLEEEKEITAIDINDLINDLYS